MKYLLTIMLFAMLCMAGCTEKTNESGDDAAADTTAVEKPVTDKTPLSDFDAVIVGDGVRLRAKPSLDANVTGKLNTGELVNVSNSSEEREAIDLDASCAGDFGYYWYKVKSRSGTSGWVYGAFLYDLRQEGQTMHEEVFDYSFKYKNKNLAFEVAYDNSYGSSDDDGLTGCDEYAFPFFYDTDSLTVYPIRCIDDVKKWWEFSCNGENQWLTWVSGSEGGRGSWSDISFDAQQRMVSMTMDFGYQDGKSLIELKYQPAGDPFSYFHMYSAKKNEVEY